MPKPKLPITITNHCYIGMYDNNYCLFYKDVPLIMVKYPFWTEHINVMCDYINYNESERGYTVLIDVPSYDEHYKLINLEHVYYGLFNSLQDLMKWLDKPYFIYY